MTIPNTLFLRNTLLADAAMGVIASAALIVGSQFLGPVLSLPSTLLFWAGVALVPIALFLVVTARKDVVPRSWLREIVLINWTWVVASVAVLIVAPVEPNLLGVVFVLAQALAVAAFAVLQGVALTTRTAGTA